MWVRVRVRVSVSVSASERPLSVPTLFGEKLKIVIQFISNNYKLIQHKPTQNKKLRQHGLGRFASLLRPPQPMFCEYQALVLVAPSPGPLVYPTIPAV